MKNKKINVAIILAGGASERFGSCKYIEKIKDIPLIFWGLKPFLNNYFKQSYLIIIVAGPHYDKILDTLNNKKDPFFGYNIKVFENNFQKDIFLNPNHLKKTYCEDLAKEKIVNLFICKNENYQNGMFSSVKKGIKTLIEIYKNFGSRKNIKKIINSVVISLADMPLIPSDIVLHLIKRLKSKFTDCVIPYTIINQKISCDKNGKTKKGHPIALKIGFILKFLKFDDNIILRDVIKTGKVKFCKTDNPGILFDIDRIEDFEKLKSFSI